MNTTPKKEDKPKNLDYSKEENNPKNENNPKTEDSTKNEDYPKNEAKPKHDGPPKKINTAVKWRHTMTAKSHVTFPLDYHSKTDPWSEMMFTIETGNRNQDDLRHSEEIKDIIWIVKTTNVKL